MRMVIIFELVVESGTTSGIATDGESDIPTAYSFNQQVDLVLLNTQEQEQVEKVYLMD